MKSTGIIRPVDSLGRIVLPISLRREMDINQKDSIEIFIEGDTVILKKYQSSCVFCDSVQDLRDYKGIMVCEKCVKDIEKL